MGKLKRIIEDSDTIGCRVFDLTIQALIVASLVAFSIETLPNLGEGTRHMLRAFELLTVVIFSLEYVARVLVADRPLGYVFSFFGIIDLLAVLPFYIASGVDLRAIRVFRLVRLVRIFKMVRYTRALERFHRESRMPSYGRTPTKNREVVVGPRRLARVRPRGAQAFRRQPSLTPSATLPSPKNTRSCKAPAGATDMPPANTTLSYLDIRGAELFARFRGLSWNVPLAFASVARLCSWE